MNSKLRCAYCKIYYRRDPKVTIEALKYNYCSVDHASAHCSALYEAANERKQAKAYRLDTKRRRDALKTKSKWLAELQALVNRYVRLRDVREGCISCDKPASWQGQWHASHYYSRGHSSALRFNLWNIHKSCSSCNKHLSGNIGQYSPRLIEKIGIERFEWLERHKSDITRFDIDWIKRAKKIFARRARQQVKRNKLNER